MATQRLGTKFQQNAPLCPSCLHRQGERNRLSFYSVAHTPMEPAVTMRLIVGVCGICGLTLPFGYRGAPTMTTACNNYSGICEHCHRPPDEHRDV